MLAVLVWNMQAGAVKAALLAGAVMLMLGGRFHGLNPRVKVDIVVFLDSA